MKKGSKKTKRSFKGHKRTKKDEVYYFEITESMINDVLSRLEIAHDVICKLGELFAGVKEANKKYGKELKVERIYK